MNTGFDFSEIRAITFDCYGTVIDWEAGILGVMRLILISHGAALSDAEILRMYGELEAQAEASAYRPYREILGEVVRGFGVRLGFTTTVAEQQALADSVVDWKPFPDTVAGLRRLQMKFKLGIISNIDDDLFSATARGLEIDFDFVTTAEEARAYKPSLEIFRLAREKMGISPEQWLHAGQSLYHDVIPAKLLGISTVRVNRPSVRPGAGAAKPASGEPDVELPDVAELAQIATR